MEALLGRVAKLGAGVAGAAFVGNNFLFNGACVFAHAGLGLRLHAHPGLTHAHRVISYNIKSVEGGFRAVVFDRFQGVLSKPLQEGTSIVIPILQVRPFSRLSPDIHDPHHLPPPHSTFPNRRRTCSTCGAGRG